jgi:hypothetical protein
MNLIAILVCVVIWVFLAVGVVCVFWFAYARRRWTVTELLLTSTVGSLPLLAALEMGLVPTEGVPPRSIIVGVSASLVIGELWSFAGAAMGLSKVPDLGPGTARRRLFWMGAGWLGLALLLTLCLGIVYAWYGSL